MVKFADVFACRFLGACLLFFASFAAAQAQAQAEWAEDGSQFRQELIIAPGAGGLRLNETVDGLPVAVRLSSQTLSFEDAGPDASGLSVYDASGAPVAFYVENYDPSARLATLWLNPGFLDPSAPARSAYLYYGADAAPVAASPEAVFSTYAGYFDFSALADGAPRNLAGPGVIEGAVLEPGFAGGSLQVSDQTLALPETLSVSAEGFVAGFWLRAEEAGTTARLFQARAPNGTGLSIALLQGRPALVLSDEVLSEALEAGSEALEAGSEADAADAEAAAGGSEALSAVLAEAAVEAGSWTHVAARYDGRLLSLFVNGERLGERRVVLDGLQAMGVGGGFEASAVRALLDPEAGEADAADAAEGEADAGGEAEAEPSDPASFVVAMDNLAIADAALSASFVFAASQAEASRGLVTFGAEEERAGLFEFAYLPVVISNVTLEGWVVIAICMLMLTIAILVMVVKSIAVGAAERANRRFDAAFDAELSEALLAARAEGEAGARFKGSTLAELYDLAASEVRRNTSEERTRLTPGALNALRARLDRTLVAQSRRLNHRMVLLTLAIAGGPFLGLLGTVIGVMITFAAIAAAGNVDVNAVGPGVAAALLTTVAGLSVAIPSLFGYNILIPRIKAINADSRAFAATLTARLAQTFGTTEGA